jgi:RNA polymerase sigma-70 factor (ECF subfamily)
MPDEITFPELIARIRAGDSEAAAELVRRYEPTIRRVARVRLGDTRLQRLFDSMDICQSVFGSFFVRTALGEYDLQTPEQVLNLLVTMSRKKVVDQTRRAGAARRDFRRVKPSAGQEERWAASEPSPSEQVAGAELLVEFRKRLTEEERSLADARASGQDWNQIAAERGSSPEALRKQLSRAIDRVSQALGLEETP